MSEAESLVSDVPDTKESNENGQPPPFDANVCSEMDQVVCPSEDLVSEDDKTNLDTEESDDHSTVVLKRKRYPYGSMFFIMSAVVGQSYSVGGAIAILEFYFTHFLYICLGKLVVGLGTASVNLFIALNQLSGLSGGFQADKIFGNFMTQCISNVMSVIGAFLLVFSTWQYTLSAPPCCHDSMNATLSHEFNKNCSEFETSIVLEDISFHIPPMFNICLAVVGLAILAIGTGQLWIQSVFVGDQFDEETQGKEQQRAFAWYYFYATIGVLGGELGMPVLRQTTGFVISLLTVAGVVVISLIVFICGSCFYVKKPPQRIRCLCACCQRDVQPRLCSGDIELDTLLKDESTGQESDEDTAENQQDESQVHESQLDQEELSVDEQSPPSTPKCEDTITQSTGDSKRFSTAVSKVKQLIPIFKVFIPLIVFWAVFYQRSSTWIVQATQMDCYLGSLHVPPDVMPSIEDVMVLFVVPFLEYLLYPHLKRSMGITVRPIHKLVCGMIAITLSFFLAGLLQIYITEPEEECRGDVSIAWQLPQLFLLSFADVLVFVTGLEFAYTQSPPDVRNMATSLYFIIQALGTVLNAAIALIPMSLLTAFFVYVGLMTLATIFFIILNRKAKFNCHEELQVSAL